MKTDRIIFNQVPSPGDGRESASKSGLVAAVVRESAFPFFPFALFLLTINSATGAFLFRITAEITLFFRNMA